MTKYCTKQTFCEEVYMSENELLALKYFYLSAKKQLDNPECKGLARKSCFQLVKTILDLSSNLHKIHDLEEVLNYGS